MLMLPLDFYNYDSCAEYIATNAKSLIPPPQFKLNKDNYLKRQRTRLDENRKSISKQTANNRKPSIQPKVLTIERLSFRAPSVVPAFTAALDFKPLSSSTAQYCDASLMEALNSKHRLLDEYDPDRRAKASQLLNPYSKALTSSRFLFEGFIHFTYIDKLLNFNAVPIKSSDLFHILELSNDPSFVEHAIANHKKYQGGNMRIFSMTNFVKRYNFAQSPSVHSFAKYHKIMPCKKLT